MDSSTISSSSSSSSSPTVPGWISSIPIPSFLSPVTFYTLIFTIAHVSLSYIIRYMHATIQKKNKSKTKAQTNTTATTSPRNMDKFVAQAPSYILSTIHAIIVTYRGAYHLLRLFRAPLPLKLANPLPFGIYDSLQPFQRRYLVETLKVHESNSIFCAYLISDLLQVMLNFPALGSYDTVLHHLSFLYCALIGGYYHLNPFMFSWLILGELSTPFLNLRWFAINLFSQYQSIINVIQFFFALSFFLTRICLYSLGLLYQFGILYSVPIPAHIPPVASYSTFAFVCVGFLLNIHWMYKILARVFSFQHRSKPKATVSKSQSESTAATDQQSKKEN